MAEIVASPVNRWLNHISVYERQFKKWESRTNKILKRYRDDRSPDRRSSSQTRFNILWSNVQMLVPATFNRLPQPDVSRRHRDTDPVARVAALLLERALEYEIQHYPDYRQTLHKCIEDRFLGGRGTAWQRYEPHFLNPEMPEGSEVTEDIDADSTELDYECSPIDYVHWQDFGHIVARTWEEVPAVWRAVYMGRPALVERFGEKLGKKIPLDSRPEDMKKRDSGGDDEDLQALIYEIWSKDDDRAYWLSKSMNKILDERQPGNEEGQPTRFEGFFPCPRPLYATTTHDSLEPIPDFTIYQDQANLLDQLSDKIDRLVTALQLKGVYDASVPALARLFTEASTSDLIPVTNWAAFAEKNGLKGALDLVDLRPVAESLMASYQAMEQVKGQVYELTGISDIIRGASDASETATAQKIKGQYASLRLRSYQEQVALFSSEMLQLRAQTMCAKYSDQTLMQICGAAQLLPNDQEAVPQALQLLRDKPLRNFRIEIAADTLVEIDEQSEKQNRMEFLTAVSGFMEKVYPMAQSSPQIAPMLVELMKFGVTGFKVGKTVEGAIDATLDKLQQAAANPQPKPPSADEMKAEVEKAKIEIEKSKVPIEQANAETDRIRAETEREVATSEVAVRNVDKEAVNSHLVTQQVMQQFLQGMQGVLAQMSQAAQMQAQASQMIAEASQSTARAATAPRRLVRDPNGRAIGSETVQ